MRHYITIGNWRGTSPRPLTDEEYAELQQLVLEQSHQAMLQRLREMTRADWDWRWRFSKQEKSS